MGIYSPSEICANCLFALAAAQILGEEKRVLYISMEDFAGLEQLFLREYEKNLTDFFFALRCRKGKFMGGNGRDDTAAGGHGLSASCGVAGGY